jgi:hypothetical protein
VETFPKLFQAIVFNATSAVMVFLLAQVIIIADSVNATGISARIVVIISISEIKQNTHTLSLICVHQKKKLKEI